MYSQSLSLRKYAVLWIVLLLLLAIVIPTTFAQGQNICREQGVQTLKYGDTVTGVIDNSLSPAMFYCFNAERGDTVTATVNPTEGLGNLMAVVYIAEPVVESANDPLGVGFADQPLGNAQAVAVIDADGIYLIVVASDQNTEGSFELTVDVEQSQSLLGTSNSSSSTDSSSTDSSSSTNLVPGETNLCSLEGIPFLEYGARDETSITPDVPQALYCFEGNQGDIVQLRVGTISGNFVPFVMISDPFFDGTSDSILAQDVATSRSDTAQIVYELAQDGTYFVLVGPGDNNGGNLYIELSLIDASASSLGCQNEPLSTLSRYAWGTSADESLITFNVSCLGIVVMNAWGANFVFQYDFNRDDALLFSMGDDAIQFTTTSFDSNSWVLEGDNAEEITLERLNEVDCDATSELIHGAWVRSGSNNSSSSSDTMIIDFMCGDLALVSVNNGLIFASYTIEDGKMTIVIPASDQEFFSGEFEVDGSELFLSQDGTEIVWTNILVEDN